MMGITHTEVRRHPRWRQEMNTPLSSPRVTRLAGTHLLGLVAILIVTVAIAVLVLKG